MLLAKRSLHAPFSSPTLISMSGPVKDPHSGSWDKRLIVLELFVVICLY
jgi:hypothetical protein